MKKWIIALLTTSLVLLPITALADAKDDRIAQLESEVEMLKEQLAELQGNSAGEDIGSGSFYLVNESGSTETGDPIIIYASEKQIEDASPEGKPEWFPVGIPIDIHAKDINGRLLSYIYIDGEFLRKEQLANSVIIIYLTKEYLSFGLHDVTVKQFENNDETTEPIFQRTAQYEVIEK